MVDLVIVPYADGLDEIRVYFEDIAPGKGYVTMICYGSAWTAYFGGMGEDTIKQFVMSVGADYMGNKMNDYSHMKQGKPNLNYLRRIINAVQDHLKSNSLTLCSMEGKQ